VPDGGRVGGLGEDELWYVPAVSSSVIGFGLTNAGNLTASARSADRAQITGAAGAGRTGCDLAQRVTWRLALGTIPAGLGLLVFACLAAIGAHDCAVQGCERLFPGPAFSSALAWGPGAVAVLTIGASFYVRRFRFGIVVPLVAWVLFALDAGAVVVTFIPAG
jgi:hypothetical protein